MLKRNFYYSNDKELRILFDYKYFNFDQYLMWKSKDNVFSNINFLIDICKGVITGSASEI